MIALVPVDPVAQQPLHGNLLRLGADVVVVHTPEQAMDARLLVLASGLPFHIAHAWLKNQGWWRELPHLVSEGLYVLALDSAGHLFAEGSEEAPRESGLSLLPGIARRLGPGARVPHLGWTRVFEEQHSQFGDPKGAWFNFAHSYALPIDEATLWQARHGAAFTALARRGRVLAAQFRPELSGPMGSMLLKSALAWVREGA